VTGLEHLGVPRVSKVGGRRFAGVQRRRYRPQAARLLGLAEASWVRSPFPDDYRRLSPGRSGRLSLTIWNGLGARTIQRSGDRSGGTSGTHREGQRIDSRSPGVFLVPPSRAPDPASGGHPLGRGASAGLRRSPRLVGGSGVAQMPLTALQKGILASLHLEPWEP